MSFLTTKKVRRPPGRPKLNKADPNITHMRVSHELKELLLAEQEGHETLNETALRLIRYRGKKAEALRRDLEDTYARNELLERRIGELYSQLESVVI